MRDTDFTAHPRRKARLLRPLFSLLALAALLLVSVPLGASAESHDPGAGENQSSERAAETLNAPRETDTNVVPGNNGTVKIDGVAFDDHPNNEPHPGCIFEVDFYNYDEGDLYASVTFTAQPPSGSDVVLHDEDIFIGQDPAGGGTDLDAAEEYDLSAHLDGLQEHDQQGYHIKLTVHAEGSIGDDRKHKVFWVECEQPQPPETGDVTLAKDATGDAPAGATFVFAVDCDDDAFDDSDVELADGNITRIVDDAPVGTVCTITETDDADADTTTFSVDGADPVAGDSVNVTIGDATTVAVLATNDFGPQPPETGDVTLAKDATGDAPAGATFVFAVDCDDDAFDDSDVELSDGNITRIVDDAPVDTVCTITETDDADADTTTFSVDGADPVAGDSVNVTIGDTTTVAVLATNDFVPAGPETFAINVLKVDEGNASNTLQGAQFRLFSDVGTAEGVVDSDDEFEGVCTTNDDGECEFGDLAAGSYLLVETRAPQGFVASSDGPITVAIVDADEDVTVENAPVAVGGVVTERSDIELEKFADPVIAEVGETITYTYRITNTGETTLSEIVLVDDKLGIILLPEVVLEPGDSTDVQETHVVTEADADEGEIVNVAVVTAESPTGERVTDEARARVEIVEVEGVTVERPEAPQAAPDAPERPDAAPEAQAGELARTGASTLWMLALAILAMLGGVGVLRIADRREEGLA